MRIIRGSWWRRSTASGALLVAASLLALPLQASSVQASPVPAGPGASAAGRPSPAFIGWRSAAPAQDRLAAGLVRPATLPISLSLTFLDGVFCTSAASCWAVGEQEASSRMATLNQVLHWNGRSWRKVSVPNPAGTGAGATGELFAVRCLTAANCWTVGEYSKNDGETVLTEALHWNGKRWSRVPTPNPAGTTTNDDNELFDVTCVTPANCWSVGDFGTPFSDHQKLLNLVLHWNGKHWSRVRLSSPGGTSANDLNELFSVRCGSARNCNSGGTEGTTSGGTYQTFNEAFHWNGKRWYQVHTPNPEGGGFGHFNAIDALACGSATNCWGAGSYGSFEPTQTSRNEILHWNGKKWTKSTVPNPAGLALGDDNQLFGATCASTRDCWALGSRETSGAAILNEALHWNGKRWAVVFTPNPAGTAIGHQNSLLAARCASASNCWAVGYKLTVTNLYENEILHWNGKKWTVHSAPGS